MENAIQDQIILEMTQLLDKTAVDAFAPIITDASYDEKNIEAVLIYLKTINARYDKQEAIAQVRALMEKYNIQIDELVGQINY